EKRPVPASPTEQRQATAAVRVVKVVLPFGNGRKEAGPLSGHLYGFTFFGRDVTDGIPGCTVRLQVWANDGLFKVLVGWVSWFGETEFRTVAGADDEHAVANLGHAVVCGANLLYRSAVF